MEYSPGSLVELLDDSYRTDLVERTLTALSIFPGETRVAEQTNNALLA
jgi:hypothetical protein